MQNFTTVKYFYEFSEAVEYVKNIDLKGHYIIEHCETEHQIFSVYKVMHNE